MAFKTSKQRSRERVVQALYQYFTAGGEVLKIEQQFLRKRDVKISKQFFSNTFLGVLRELDELEELILPTLNRKFDELGLVERSVLYLGVFELQNHAEIPYKVVISQALDVAKLYGAQGAYKLINHSLDQLAKQLRIIETSQP